MVGKDSMTPRTVFTLPVYSQLADPLHIPEELRARLPSGFRLYKHQVDTYRELLNGSADVIFNIALTGDGKSLAGQLPALVRGGINWSTLIMYPTNELINDQVAHLEQTQKTWQADMHFGQLNAAELDRLFTSENYERRGDALLRVLRNQDILLSNPDIFHFVMHQFYTHTMDALDRYSAVLSQRFSQFTFDEFHIFQAPEVVSILNALLFLTEVGGAARRPKFLFLSATPGDLMLDYLDRSGLHIAQVAGCYTTEGEQENFRRILNATELNFVSQPRAVDWVEMHREDILLQFLLDHQPGAKGAIIVNSIASAQRIYELIQPLFARYGLSAALNTGLIGRTRRQASYQADMLIGTSTVDVGVDFQINFLVFESRDAGSFLQRLGRLGRHAGYERNGCSYPFEKFIAYGLLPDWIISRLFTAQPGAVALLTTQQEVDRQSLAQAIYTAYPSPTTFDRYAQSWGKLQSVRILWGLGRAPIREQYAQTRGDLYRRYEKTYGVHLASCFGQYKALARAHSPIWEAAISFRGSAEFPCCIIDSSEPSKLEQFKKEDLLRLIPNYDLEYLSKAEFERALLVVGLDPRHFQRPPPLGYFRLGSIHEYQPLTILLDRNLLAWSAEKFGVACDLQGVRLDASFPGAAEINHRLSQLKVAALLCSGLQPLELKRRLNLPLLFPLFPFRSLDEVNGTIAFGRTALMLESRLKYSSLPTGGRAIIV